MSVNQSKLAEELVSLPEQFVSRSDFLKAFFHLASVKKLNLHITQ